MLFSLTLLGIPAKADETGKSKAELKAERRQKQEAQRAAKAAPAAVEAKQSAAPKASQTKRVPDQIQADRPSVEKRLVKRCVSQKVRNSYHQRLYYLLTCNINSRFHSFLQLKEKFSYFPIFSSKKEEWDY